MAVRQIRVLGDEILTKKCKPVKEVNARILELIDDMFETMYDSSGVGLAASQVGVLKQIVVMDVGPREDSKGEGGAATGPNGRTQTAVVLINPEILEQDGTDTAMEGCLSVPGKSGQVTRFASVKVRAYDTEMKPFEIDATGLLARCIQHECDHLNGRMYVELVEGDLVDNETEAQE
ncbi:MAG: peptide deformylase [Lachnospiraceae bacterium]|nr:peptide deformylase [Lachnospiraceae bacterium]